MNSEKKARRDELNTQIQHRLIEELTSSKKRYQTLIDNLTEIVFECDEKGIITFLNPAWFKSVGYPVDDSLNHSIGDYMHVSDRAAGLAWLVDQNTLIRRREFRFCHKNGDVLWMETSAEPGENGGIIGFLYNVTERKTAEETLHKLNDHLEHLVEERTLDLKIKAEALEKTNKELDQFAYIVSHDLKAPLRAINNLSVWMEEDLNEKLSKDDLEHMVLLRARVKRMENLINGILEYSRAGRSTAKMESIDMPSFLKDILDSLAPPKTFSIKQDIRVPLIEARELLLGQVLSNLISNAVKYHDRPDGHVEIVVSDEGDYVLFEVSDDGPGIPDEFHEKIFGIFQTIQSRDNKESTGIGLSIVKKIVEEEGGKIILDSRPGQGATFAFTWPKK